MDRLKPCPFCGSKSVNFRYYYSWKKECFHVFVKCANCYTRSGFTFCDDNPVKTAYTNEASLEIARRWNSRSEV